MEWYSEKFKLKTGNSEIARADRVVLLCCVINAILVSAMLIRECFVLQSTDIDPVTGIKVCVIALLLIWFPIIVCKVMFYKLIMEPKLIRDTAYSTFVIAYMLMLIFIRKPGFVMFAIPYLVMSVAYGSIRFSTSMGVLFSAIAYINAIMPVVIGKSKLSFEAFHSPNLVLAVSLMLVLTADLFEKSERGKSLQLDSERKKLSTLVEIGIGRVFEYDTTNDVIVLPARANDTYGVGRTIENFSKVAEQFRYILYADWGVFEDFIKDCRAGKEDIDYQFRLRNKNADYKWYRIKARTTAGEDGANNLVIGYMENIDERKRLELRVADENMRDSLTKLYRMDYTREKSAECLDRQVLNDNGLMATVLTIDIDGFEKLNSKLGNAFGDEIIKNVAHALDDIFYPTDVLGRVGGDEFVVLMDNIKSKADIEKKILEIREVISRTYVGEDDDLKCSACIGAAIYPTDATTFDELYDMAEKAMYHAKSAGPNQYGFYNPDLKEVYECYRVEQRREAKAEIYAKDTGATSDSLIELAFKLIDESKDTDSAINLLIRQVARQLNLGGICIKTRAGKELRLISRYSCTSTPELEFDNMDITYTLAQWGDMLDAYRYNNNLVAYENIEDIESFLDRQILLSMGARSYVGVGFFDKGEFAGNIDFIDFDEERKWSNDELTVMRAVANVVSAYLLKMKAFEDASDTVERLTGYDSVTGLLLYEKFVSLVGEYIENAPHGKYAMIYMDFTNFKYVNETYGYETGDKILRKLAEEAESYKDNFIFGSRVFSDNIVVFAKIGDRPEEELTAKFINMSKNFTNSIQSEYIDSKLIVGIGVCTFEICGKPIPLKNIISNANVARKRTKIPDAPRCIIYNDDMGKELKNEIAYALDMENAFRNHEFVVYMQPKVNLKTNQIDGAEALIRWRKQDGRLIFPNDFIPVFEKNKSITLLDFYVYDEVCKYIRNRIDEGKKVVRVSINVSRVHLFDVDDLVSYIKSLLQKYDLPPQYLEFELTETVFSDRVDDTVNLMTRLRELGVLISMDDFGSGYSSLNALTKLPLDVLKLDKEFLDDFDDDPDEKIIIPSVIDMAKKLNLTVVCEGVETKEQVAFLRDVGCDYAQGYFYSKPIPQEQFDELLDVVD